jgi:hypothetical protein
MVAMQPGTVHMVTAFCFTIVYHINMRPEILPYMHYVCSLRRNFHIIFQFRKIIFFSYPFAKKCSKNCILRYSYIHLYKTGHIESNTNDYTLTLTH